MVEGKPAPECFRKVAQKLGFAASDCLVIEDAPAGGLLGPKLRIGPKHGILSRLPTSNLTITRPSPITDFMHVSCKR